MPDPQALVPSWLAHSSPPRYTVCEPERTCSRGSLPSVSLSSQPSRSPPVDQRCRRRSRRRSPNPAFDPFRVVLQAYIDQTQAFRKQAAEAAEKVPGKSGTTTGAETSVRTRQNDLAEALRTTLRPNAQQGELFTPHIAPAIRRHIAEAFNSPMRDLLIDELAEQNTPPASSTVPAINQELQRAARTAAAQRNPPAAAHAARIRLRRRARSSCATSTPSSSSIFCRTRFPNWRLRACRPRRRPSSPPARTSLYRCRRFAAARSSR